MEKEKLARISALSRKSRAEGLTEEEAAEQARLREEYLCEIRLSFGSTLEHTVIERPDGTREKLRKKPDGDQRKGEN